MAGVVLDPLGIFGSVVPSPVSLGSVRIGILVRHGFRVAGFVSALSLCLLACCFVFGVFGFCFGVR